MAMAVWKLYIGGAVMPTPSGVVRLTDKIWSESTGRSASGKMLGGMVAEKKKLNLSWKCLTFEQAEVLRSAISGTEFIDLSMTGYDGAVEAYTGYFGELSMSDYSWAAPGLRVATDVSVSFVEQ